MLLTITYTPAESGQDARDLGFLLHKNPGRAQKFDLNLGRVYVFYPEASAERCTAALLLDIDPLDLARGRQGAKEAGLFDYVNDRPYVCSSFMSVAIARVLGAALHGRCEQRRELAETALDLRAELTMLPCRGDTGMIERVFAPLGYRTEFSQDLLDEAFPEWGQSRYVNLSLRGRVRLRDLLRHIYVLIPVFDRQKHYWIGAEEVEKLLTFGEGWLENHPEKNFITRRYFKSLSSFSRMALERMDNGEAGQGQKEIAVEDNDDPPAETEENVSPHVPLNTLRLEAVMDALKESGAQSVIDLGCGQGNLLRLLMKERSFTRIAGTDVSVSALERARERLHTSTLPEAQSRRLSLFQSSLTYRDKRFSGYDAAAALEVIEHIDPDRLYAFSASIFGDARPGILIVTTPNAEYNALYPSVGEGRMRHRDHRFEWTRREFQGWCEKTAADYGYQVTFRDVGGKDAERGCPTQMGVFKLCG